jgi:lipoic acid synthetase
MKLPSWFRQEIPDKEIINNKFSFLRGFNLNTVCESAHCPNLGKCFQNGELTFMILGDACTRNCKFCAVKKNNQGNLSLNHLEPINITRAVEELNLDYVVITSVSRDDLKDGGAAIFAETIKEIRNINSEIKIEILVPDFQGKFQSIETITKAKPDVIAHNLETVPRLFKTLRDKKANYKISLQLLKAVKEIDSDVFTKSSLMLGLGESDDEVCEVMQDLRSVDCDMLTLGQYLAPSKEHYPIKKFISLAQFKKYEEFALSLGFKAVASGPLVRSSYKAKELYARCMNSLLSELVLQV